MLTTIRSSTAGLKMPMTTDFFRHLLQSTASIFQGPATAFATRCILKDSVCLVRQCSVQTAIHPHAAALACWPSAQAVLMWRLPWAEGPLIWHILRLCL